MTIKDIAAKCQVSVSTVSRVLNNQPYVKEDVRAKVLQTIEEEHFVPHEGAVALAKTQEDSIGLIVRGMRNPFFNDMVSTILEKSHELGYNAFMSQISTDEDELLEAASIAKSKKAKGVVLLGGQFDHTPEDLKMIDVPVVCCTFTNSFGTIPKESFSSVCIDDEQEVKKAIKYLADKGHKRIAIALPAIDDKSIGELRYRGFCHVMKELNLEVHPELVIQTGDFTMESTFQAVKRSLESGSQFTALLGVSDVIAMAAMKAISESGLRIPEDCSVMGIDGIEMTNYAIPTLTTLVQPRELMANRAVEILHQMITKDSYYVHEIVETDLRMGQSVKDI